MSAREDRLGQAIRLTQSGGQGNAAHRTGLLVVLPSGADQVTAHHSFDGQCTQAPDDHAAFLERCAFGRIGHGARQRIIGEMVRHDVPGACEPEIRDLREHAALAGNRVGHHDIEGTQAIGSDDQHVLLVDRVDVAHLALMDALQTGNVRFEHR
jgi:hypothetical protein